MILLFILASSAAGIAMARKEDAVVLNPFHESGGCLRSKLGDEFPKRRACNSEDDRYFDEDGIATRNCDEPEFDYPEIRIQNQDWDSPMMSAWIMQILLSELLGVPTSIETSKADGHYNFYDPLNRVDYSSKAYNFESLHAAKEAPGGDCRILQEKAKEEGVEYRGCANVMPMVNKHGQAAAVQKMKNGGIIAQPRPSGVLAQYRWWMPMKFAKKRPSLQTYFGLQGQENRHKVAKQFKRPTTWGDYCEQVSLDNCSLFRKDDTAARAPQDQDEAAKYFAEGLYKGHFRYTEKNNCTANPTTCTGHIANVPCSWGNYAVPQAHHLNIPVESDGPLEPSGNYGYSSLLEIYSAANATGENVIMYWWEPEASMELYKGTDHEWVPIHLPPPTKECLDNRVSEEERCSSDPVDQVGSPLGSCDAGPVSNLMLTTLEDDCGRQDDEHATCSPAHAALQSYEITNVNLMEIYRYRNENPTNDGREAVCSWFVENLDVIRERFVPRKYPREQRKKGFYDPLTCISIVLAVLSTLCVAFCAYASKFFEKTKVMKYAQVDFLLLILSGLFLVTVSAVLYSIPPSTGVCISRPWFLAVGYSLELIPLAVKVAAINKICQQSRKMRRIDVKKSRLYQIVGGCILVVCVYLATWTAVDPSTSQTKMTLTNEESESGNFVVKVSGFCSSSSKAWQIALFLYLLVLLLISAAIATQNRGIRQEFNESRYLAFMIYSHLMFMILRAITFLISDKLENPNMASAGISILLSVDTFITIGIYFVPKLVEAKRSHEESLRAATAITRNVILDRKSSMEEADPHSFTWKVSRRNSTPMRHNDVNNGIDHDVSNDHNAILDRRSSMEEADPNSFTWTVSRRNSTPMERHNDENNGIDHDVSNDQSSFQEASHGKDAPAENKGRKSNNCQRQVSRRSLMEASDATSFTRKVMSQRSLSSIELHNNVSDIDVSDGSDQASFQEYIDSYEEGEPTHGKGVPSEKRRNLMDFAWKMIKKSSTSIEDHDVGNMPVHRSIDSYESQGNEVPAENKGRKTNRVSWGKNLEENAPDDYGVYRCQASFPSVAEDNSSDEKK